MNRNRKVKRNRRMTAAAVLAVSTAMMFSGTSLPVLAANTTVVSGQQAGTWQEARIGGITWGYQVDSEGQAVRLYAKSGNISGALDEKGNLIIPGQVGGHSVTSIGGGSISQPVFSAGNADKTVTGIVLPATVSKIEDYAFYNVTMAPQSVTIPGTVKSIGSYAFAGSGIRELSLAGFTGSIGDGAFSACAYLTSAYIQTDNGSALTLGKNAFANDTALSSLVINNAGTLSIGDYAFSSSGINSLILDGTVKVGASAFAGCNRLTGVSIGKNVSFDGGTPFEGCSVLSDVSTDADLKDDVFSGCDSIGQLFVKGDVRNVSAKWNGSNVTGRTLNVYVLSPETKFGSTPTLSAFGGSISKTSVFYANGGAVKTGKAEAGNYDCATYAQNDDWKNLAVANVSFYSGTFTQDGNSYTFKADDGSTFNANDGMNASATIRASYSGALRTGQTVQRDNVTVMNTKTGEKISEFYVLRKTDADSLMNKYGNADALKTALTDVKDVRADSSDLMTADGASGILYASVISFVDGKAVQSDLNIRVEKTNIDPEDTDYKTFEDMLNQINNLKIRSILLDNAVRRADDTNTIVTAMSKDEYKKDADTVSNVLKLAATPVDTLSSDGQKVLDAALAGLSDTDKAAVKDAMADYAQTSSKGTVEDIFYTYLTRTCKMSDSDAKALLTADLTSDDTATQELLEKLTSDQRNKAKELSTANDGYKSMSSDLKQAIDDEEKVILSLADQTINLTSLKDYTTKAGQLKTALETAQSEIEKAKEQYNGLAEALKKYAATHTAGNIDFVGTQTTDGKDVVYLNGTAFPYDKDSGADTEVTLEDGTHTVKAYNAVGSPWKYQGDVSVEKGTFKFYAMLDGIHVISATDENGKALSIDPNKENSAQTPLGGVFTQSLTTALNNAVNSADSAFSAISSADEAMASYINAMVESGLLDKAQKIDLTGDTGTDTTKIADAMKALTNAYSAYRTQYTKYQEGHTLTTDQVNDLLSTVNNLRDKADNVESYVTKLMTDKNLTDGDKSKLTDVLTAAVNIKNTALDDENYFKSLKNAFSIAENTSNSRAAQQIVNTVTDLRNQVSKLGASNATLTNNNKKLTTENASLSSSANNYKTQANQSASTASSLKSQLASAQSTSAANAQKVTNLQNQYNTLKNQYDQLSASQKNYTDQITALQQQLSSTQQKLSEAQQQAASKSTSSGSSGSSYTPSYSSSYSSPYSSSSSSDASSTASGLDLSDITGTAGDTGSTDSATTGSSIAVTSGTGTTNSLTDTGLLASSGSTGYTPTNSQYANGFTDTAATTGLSDTTSDTLSDASTTESTEEGEETPVSNKNKAAMLLILLAVLCGLCGVGFYLWKSGKLNFGGGKKQKSDENDIDDLMSDDDEDGDDYSDDFGDDDQKDDSKSDDDSTSDNDSDSDDDGDAPDTGNDDGDDDDGPDFGQPVA